MKSALTYLKDKTDIFYLEAKFFFYNLFLKNKTYMHFCITGIYIDCKFTKQNKISEISLFVQCQHASWIFIVVAYCNNSPQENMLLHSDT